MNASEVLPAQFNVAAWFVDRNVAEGRGASPAFLFEDRTLTYADVQELVNRTGNTLLELGVEMEHRVLMLCLDAPEFIGTFWGAIKIGAIPIPVNTLMRTADYLYFLNDSRAKVAVISAPLLAEAAPALREARDLRHVLIARYRPTLFFGVPTLYAGMLAVKDAEARFDTSSLRLCVSAGEALPDEIYKRWRERFGVEIIDGIGTTEICHVFISNRPGRARPGSSGLPVEPGRAL